MAYQLVYIADSLKKILSTKKHLISPVSGFIGAPSSYNVPGFILLWFILLLQGNNQTKMLIVFKGSIFEKLL